MVLYECMCCIVKYSTYLNMIIKPCTCMHEHKATNVTRTYVKLTCKYISDFIFVGICISCIYVRIIQAAVIFMHVFI